MRTLNFASCYPGWYNEMPPYMLYSKKVRGRTALAGMKKNALVTGSSLEIEKLRLNLVEYKSL